MTVIEVAPSIDKRLLVIGRFQHDQKLVQRVTELFCGQSARAFHIEHRYQVLLSGQALGHEVGQLMG